ncbi:PqqA peptide cyclase [Anaerolineales bacterium]|nr:PqqA peptide cyclase [Anaerolineales bacterium]
MMDLNKLEKSFNTDIPQTEPTTAYFNVISRCNAGCRYCLDWKNNSNVNTDVSIQKIEEILTSLKKLGVIEVAFSGGEPYLRRDILDILRLAKNMGFVVRVITNGSAFTDKDMYKTIESGISKIGISIDSINATKFELIRGLNLDRVKSNIEKLVHLREQSHKTLDLSLYVTITKLNIEDLIPLAKYAQMLDVKIQYQPVHFSGTGLEDYILDNLWPNDQEINNITSVIYELIAMQKTVNNIGNRPEYLAQIPVFFRQKTFYPTNRCYVAYVDVVIDQDLGVRPCWSMFPVGFLTNHSLEELWVSEKMREMRSIIRLQQCPGCLYSCHINKKHVSLPPVPLQT